MMIAVEIDCLRWREVSRSNDGWDLVGFKS